VRYGKSFLETIFLENYFQKVIDKDNFFMYYSN